MLDLLDLYQSKAILEQNVHHTAYIILHVVLNSMYVFDCPVWDASGGR